MRKVIVATRKSSCCPEFAGSTWVRLQWVLGLQQLGIESYWIDDIGPLAPDRVRRSLPFLVNRFKRTADDFGFGDRWCIVCNGGEQYFGMTAQQFLKLARDADLVLCVSGYLRDSSPMLNIPRRAFVDVDPGFTQLWALHEDMGFAKFNFFFTIGQNVGKPGFDIPTLGIPWQSFFPPIVLDQWPVAFSETEAPFSTVGDWRGSQNATFRGEHYSGKRAEFLRFLDLPKRVKQEFELALCISPWEHEDIALLINNGWSLVEPSLCAGDPHTYREYVRNSRAEFSVAKNGYVRSNSGWISDRTACYLASGKPTLVQSTGLEGSLPVGEGLVTFRRVEEAAAGVEAINSDYVRHCAAARRLAETYFDSERVLGQILERTGL